MGEMGRQPQARTICGGSCVAPMIFIDYISATGTVVEFTNRGATANFCLLVAVAISFVIQLHPLPASSMEQLRQSRHNSQVGSHKMFLQQSSVKRSRRKSK